MKPDRRGAPPSWGRKPFPREAYKGRFVALASSIEAMRTPCRCNDARVLALALKAGRSRIPLRASAPLWLPGAASGRIRVNGVEIGPGDGAAIRDERLGLRVVALDDAEVLLADTRP